VSVETLSPPSRKNVTLCENAVEQCDADGALDWPFSELIFFSSCQLIANVICSIVGANVRTTFVWFHQYAGYELEPPAVGVPRSQLRFLIDTRFNEPR
jgi:hypothetical protein